jgi:hypothetical protein
MTRAISKQEKAQRRFNYQMSRSMVVFTEALGMTARKTRDDIYRFMLSLSGQEAAWPQFNHEKEKPERSRMHAMYARRRRR